MEPRMNANERKYFADGVLSHGLCAKGWAMVGGYVIELYSRLFAFIRGTQTAVWTAKVSGL